MTANGEMKRYFELESKRKGNRRRKFIVVSSLAAVVAVVGNDHVSERLASTVRERERLGDGISAKHWPNSHQRRLRRVSRPSVKQGWDSFLRETRPKK